MKINKIATTLFIAMGMSSASFAQQPGDEDHAPNNETKAQHDERMQWWRDAKFGMFIHWGIYSGLAGEWNGQPTKSGEWLQKVVDLDTDTYSKAALPLFAPKDNFAAEWAQLAEESGCQYAVLTTKHHDGFALFESKQGNFNSFDLKGRDLVKEYVEAFRNKNIKIGFYHSMIDWHHPSYDYTIDRVLSYPSNQAKMLEEKKIPRDHETYLKYLHGQVNELLTNYGQIDVIWWDFSRGKMSGNTGWEAPALIEMVKKLQPSIIMNNRLYNSINIGNTKIDGLDLRTGDFVTPENTIPNTVLDNTDWEACVTVGDYWGYSRFDTNLKSKDDLILKLAECVTRGGNLLLNINPQADGTVPMTTTLAIKGVGAWIKVNGQAVYGSRPYQMAGLPANVAATQKGDEIFLFILRKGDTPLEAPLKLAMPEGYANAAMLGSETPVQVSDNSITVTPEMAGSKTVPVIKLTK